MARRPPLRPSAEPETAASPPPHPPVDGECGGIPSQPIKQLFAYRLKISVKGMKPPVWRRLLGPKDIRLSQLHCVGNRAIGWEDAHLNALRIDRMPYEPGTEPGARDERRVKLSQVADAGFRFLSFRRRGHQRSHCQDVFVRFGPDGSAMVLSGHLPAAVGTHRRRRALMGRRKTSGSPVGARGGRNRGRDPDHHPGGEGEAPENGGALMSGAAAGATTDSVGRAAPRARFGEPWLHRSQSELA
jgi:hypothetical protein